MHRTYTFRLKTTRKQDERLDAMLKNLCGLYNMCLRQRRDEWEQNKKRITRFDQQKYLTDLRNSDSVYDSYPCAIQQGIIQRLDGAFQNFFRRVKAKENPGYPRFKNEGRIRSFTLSHPKFDIKDDHIRIVGFGWIKCKTRCKLKGIPKQLIVKRCGSHWTARIVFDIGEAPEKVSVSNAIGIDLGLTSLATLSDGTEITNPRWTRQMEDKLALANQDLSRKEKGSKNRAKSKERLRRVHQKIAGLRSSYLVSVAKQLVSQYDLIAHEDLQISNMTQSRLAKSILDAAWNQLLHRLNCEAEKAGKWVVPVNPRGTTQTCSSCGEKVKKKLSQRIHECPNCGLQLGRDHNAAINILALGRSAVETQKTYLVNQIC